MGVMSCRRRACDNIMCDTYIPNVGYVCSECQNEFKDYLENNNKTNLTESELINELETFMDTNKGYHKEKIININDFFDKFTR